MTKWIFAAPLSAMMLSVATVVSVTAQVPSPSEAQAALRQAVQQQPGLADVIRSRLRQSGMTAEQVRARLQASGYAQNLLDAYLGSAAPGQGNVLPGQYELNALEALGLPPISGQIVTLDTGLVRIAGSLPSDVFGVDVFQRTTTQFLPLLAGPVPNDYKLGPGDNLVLILTGDVELAYSLPVTREGFLVIPQVGQVYVANLTLDQLRELLYTRLGRVYSGVRRGPNATTRFDVSVANVRANQIYVIGEVAQPGAYQISSLGTVLTALYAAGGMTERAKLRGVDVLRSGKRVATFDLYDYLLKGNTHDDIRLETGDVVFVPVHESRVRLRGAVLRPAVYELKAGETIADLVAAAGGFRPDAALQRLKVQRVLPPDERGAQTTARVTIDVPLSGKTLPKFTLEDGDEVQVDSLESVAEQYLVTINGMVQQPGPYPWRPGMTLRQLVVLARGPKTGADLREAEIARLPGDRSHGQLATTLRVPLDSSYLFEIDSAGRYIGLPGVAFPAQGTAAEVSLEPFDNVLIFQQPNFELQRTVTIAGQVRFPGTYALQAKDDRLSALIARAGGLNPQAYPEGIRFMRAMAQVGRINIDLPRALRDPSSRDNMILQPGDSIEIPEYQPSVKVVGAVNSPGSVLYRRGAGLDYYLSAAGGFSQRANKGGVSVRLANGETRTRRRALFFSSNPTPGPGSEVFVPFRDPAEAKTDYVALFGSIAQIVASTIAIIVVVKR
jgi:protein involved in polysaccharide export with SLBB domain